MGEHRRFLKESVVTLMAKGINLLLGIIISVLIARILGPERRGVYAISILLASFIIKFGGLGFNASTTYFVARKEYRYREIFGNNIILGLSISIILVFVGYILISYYRNAFFSRVGTTYLYMALTLVPVELTFNYVFYILLGMRKIIAYNFILFFRYTLLLIFVMIFVYYLRLGIVGALCAQIIGKTLIMIFVFIVIFKLVGGIDMRLNLNYLKKSAKYSMYAHISSLLVFLNYRLDVFLLNFFLEPSAVGYYSVGVGLIEKIWLVSQSVSTVIFPKVASEEKMTIATNFTSFVSRTLLSLTLIVVIILALYARIFVVLLYSSKYLPTVNVVRGLLVGVVSLSVWRVLVNDIAARGYPKFNIIPNILGVLFNLILNVIFIPRFGITGAAWASSISYTVSFIGALIVYCKLTNTKWSDAVFVKKSDIRIYASALYNMISLKK